jgi:hypothetical protein
MAFSEKSNGGDGVSIEEIVLNWAVQTILIIPVSQGTVMEDIITSVMNGSPYTVIDIRLPFAFMRTLVMCLTSVTIPM